MAKPIFTDLFLRKLPSPASGRAEYYDGRVPGFGVRVHAGGTKTFFLVGRHNGKFKRVSLGRYPATTLEKARKRATAAFVGLADGVDPHAAKREAARASAMQFAAVLDDFVEHHCRQNNRASTAAETERLLRSVFLESWARMDVRELRKTDVFAILDPIVSDGRVSAARHAFAALRKMLNWCVERGIIEHSPCAGIKAPGRPSSRERVLDDEELASLLRAAREQPWPFGPIVQLLIFTAQRRGEVVGMQWSEIDLEAKLWAIPGARTKNKRKHVVPLTASAIAVLRDLPRIEACPYIFPARGYSDRPYSGYSKGKRELDQRLDFDNWTLHDLRRTAATGMAKSGIAPHVVERVLNHVSGSFGGVAGVYNRFQYLDEMRQALEAWELHMIAISR